MHMRITPILLVSLLLVSCSNKKEDYLAKGDRLKAAGRLADAAINYRKAIQKDPTYGLAYYHLGQVQLAQKNPTAAYGSLTSANHYLPDNAGVKLELSRLSMGAYLANPRHPSNLHDQVSQLTGEILSKDPNSVDALLLQGTLALADQRSDDAIKLLTRADSLKPNDPDVILPLAGALAQSGQGAQADRLVESLIARDKKAVRAYDFLYVRYRQTGRLPDAERILNLKADNNPDSSQWLLELAEFYRSQANDARMRATLDRIVSAPQRYPDAHLVVGRYYLGAARIPDAMEQFQAGLKQDPQRTAAYQKGIAAAQRATGKVDDALATVNTVLAKTADDQEAQAMKAALLLQKGNLDGALELYKNLVKVKDKDGALRYEYAHVLALKGDPQATREFREAARLAPQAILPRIAIVEQYLRAGDYSNALRESEEVQSQWPKEPQVALLHALSLAGQGQHDQARTELVRLTKDAPQFGEGYFQLAMMDIGDRRFADARELLEKLYKPGMGDLRPLRGLIAVDVNEKQFAGAVKMLQEEIQRSPGSDELRYLMAETLISSGKVDEGVAQLEQLRAKSPASKALALRLGDLYRKKGDLPKAIASYQQASTIDPKDPGPPALLGLIYLNQGNRAEAIAAFRNSEKLGPNNAAVLNNLAFLLADGDQNLDEALTLAQKAVQSDPSNASYADTLGWVYYKKNMMPSAVQTLTNASTRDPGVPMLHYHLAAALLRSGDSARAREELGTALSQKPVPQDEQKIRQLLAEAGGAPRSR